MFSCLKFIDPEVQNMNYMKEDVSWSQKFTYTFQNLQNVNYFTKIRGIIQNACYCLFSTDLNKIFHKKDV